jgi:hypothetical protein
MTVRMLLTVILQLLSRVVLIVRLLVCWYVSESISTFSQQSFKKLQLRQIE